MSEAAASLRGLAVRVDEAAGALMRARFGELADAVAELEMADLTSLRLREGLCGDAEAAEACRALRRALDRMGALLGHVAGVQRALQGADPADAAVYDRRGAGAASAGGLLREEA